MYDWYTQLSKEGEKFGYLVNGSESWLIVKSEALADEARGCLEMNMRGRKSSAL